MAVDENYAGLSDDSLLMIHYLNSLADGIAKRRLLRHVIFLNAALIAICISGYHFGTFDQVVHLPFLRKFADPTLYPTDPFLALREEHYSYFWLLFVPALRAGILEIVMFAVHIIATYGLFWMFWELTDALFHNDLANLFSIGLLIFPHMGLPGFQFIEYSLLNRTFVLPFILGAIILYLRRRYLFSFLILGVMFNIHVIFVGFAMTMILFDCLLRLREIGWKNILKGSAVFIIGALPVLFWRSGGAPVDLQIRPDVLKLIASALLAGVYYIYLPYPFFVFNLINGICTLIFFILGIRLKLSEYDRTLTNFVVAIGLVLLVQIVTTYWLPVVFILQLQILRIGFFLQITGYLYFAGYLAKRLQNSSLKGLGGAVVILAFVTHVSSLIPILFLFAYQWLARALWRQWLALSVLILIQLATVYSSVVSGYWSPGIVLFEPETSWTQAQDWARENTPKDAMFITPPQLFFSYVPDWRTFSERGTLATLVEVFEFPHPDYFPSWQTKFNAIAPFAIQKFNGNYFDTMKITKDAYYSLKPEDLIKISKKYNVRYLVIEKPHLQPFPMVYENNGFVIYDLLQIR